MPSSESVSLISIYCFWNLVKESAAISYDQLCLKRSFLQPEGE